MSKKQTGQLCGSCVHLPHCALIFRKKRAWGICSFGVSQYRKDARRPLPNYQKRVKAAKNAQIEREIP